MIDVKKVSIANEVEWRFIRQIREEVFVKEQNVPIEEEYDEFEQSAVHFLAFYLDKAVGTCRWRITSEGVKMERFAVLKMARGNGVASKLVEACLSDIASNPATQDSKIYLNAQTTVMSLYAKYGFVAEGEEFDECGIMHYKMVKRK